MPPANSAQETGERARAATTVSADDGQEKTALSSDSGPEPQKTPRTTTALLTRKVAEIDPMVVKYLAGCQLTSAQIAAKVGCSELVLERYFSPEITQGRHCGAANIKIQIHRLAIGEKQAWALKWVAKQLAAEEEAQRRAAEQQAAPQLSNYVLNFCAMSPEEQRRRMLAARAALIEVGKLEESPAHVDEEEEEVEVELGHA